MTDLTFNDGRTMPQLGMGTYQIPDAQAAAIYDNERGVGEGVNATDVFLTTKLWNDRQGDPRAALDESLALLGVEAVDLYLIHWPAPAADAYVDAWKTLVQLRDAGLTRSIGVSNFLPEHLDRIIEATGVTPAVNQIELHPRFQRREEVAYHQAAGIVTQSWSPIGQGKSLLTDPVIEKIAGKHARSAAQVVIAWHLAKGYSVIPKASSHDHLTDNLAAQDLTLDDEDIAALDGMDCGERLGPDPRTFG